MKRTKLADRVLPVYTKGEEVFNMVSHIVGAALGVAATALCVIFAAIHGNGYGVVSGAIYGFFTIVLYTMSSIYHGLRADSTGKKVLQIIDHCTIFVFIAGSYTPFALCTFREYNTALGWTIFGIIWAIAVVGVTLNAIDIKKYKIFSMFCYLIMGWCVIVKGALLQSLLGVPGFILLLSGGIVYTVGAIFYGVGKKKKYMHSIFHLCILIASILQFLCILLYVM